MRTALITGLIAGGVFALLNYGQLSSNADFVYMCAALALLKKGVLLASPYFPPGYPLALWGLSFTGLTPLTSAALLSAFGMGLCAGAVAYTARLWQVPPSVALCLGLLCISLPDVFQTGCNPHLDALYTGLGAVLIATALRCFNPRAHAGLALTAMLCAALLLSFRWHAVLLVVPLGIVLCCYRQARLAGICILATAACALGYTYWALYTCTGSLATAAQAQLATGAAYRAYGATAPLLIFNEYAAWLSSHPPVTFQTILDGVLLNWPLFLLRKAVLLGAGAWLLGVLICRRAPAGSLWLPLLIAGYTLAVSPTYFTPRASALPEVAGVMLCAAGLSVLFFSASAAPRGRRSRGGGAGLSLDPAVVGAVLCLLLLAGLGYNAWREAAQVRQWRASAAVLRTANAAAAKFANHDRRLVYGALDHCGWTFDAAALPGATYSRLWLDDPAFGQAFTKLLPKYAPADVVAGRTPVRAVLLWREVDFPLQRQLEQGLPASTNWREAPSGTKSARLFVRR